MNGRALFLACACVVVACGGGADDADDGAAGGVGAAGTASLGGQSNTAGGTNASAGSTNVSGSTSTSGGGSGTAGSTSAGSGSGGSAGSAEGGSTNGGAAQGGSTPGGAAQGGSADGGKSNGGSSNAGAGGAASGLTFDYSLWQLQLPTGSSDTSADTIQPDQLKTYSSTYFSKAADGGLIFADPVSGPTTGNSDHPRSELREIKPSATWKVSGTNTLTVKGKAIKCPHACTIGQIFRNSPSGTLIELQYSGSSGKMQLLYEEVKGSPDPVKDLGVSIPIGQTYTYEFSLSNGKLDVSINGSVKYSRTPASAAVSGGVYFKVGDYDQSSTRASTTSSTINSQIEVYSVVVVHQ